MNFEDLFSVSEKVVCVTGGGGGIGRGIARTFVSGGAKVYIASRSDLSDVATEISKEGPGECLVRFTFGVRAYGLALVRLAPPSLKQLLSCAGLGLGLRLG